MNPFQEMFEINWDLWRCGNCKSKVKVYYHPYDSKIFSIIFMYRGCYIRMPVIFLYCRKIIFYLWSLILDRFWRHTSIRYQMCYHLILFTLRVPLNNEEKSPSFWIWWEIQKIFVVILSILVVSWRCYIPKLRYHCINTWSSLLANDYDIII